MSQAQNGWMNCAANQFVRVLAEVYSLFAVHSVSIHSIHPSKSRLRRECSRGLIHSYVLGAIPASDETDAMPVATPASSRFPLAPKPDSSVDDDCVDICLIPRRPFLLPLSSLDNRVARHTNLVSGAVQP